MNGAFEKARIHASDKQEIKAKQWMVKESDVVQIVQRAIAEFQQDFNLACTMDSAQGGTLVLSGDFFEHGKKAIEEIKEESNWFPDWEEVEGLKNGSKSHRLIKG